ncbi:hypothetical protein [Comamonas sp.]|uniref:hypothetical protein n=1 Tax=Comamonas sp. TaxID=34028 RepID=UPI00289FB400|nr:hypothetical protein [Comamonas sp.]
MAYYTGSVTSYGDLLNALVAACTAERWTWANGILSKGAAFVRPTALETLTGNYSPGLRIEGGTGQSGSTLLNPSVSMPRCGAPGNYANWGQVTWPAQYHLHVNSGPDEVYLVLNTNVSDFYWLCFGVSSVPLPGTGLWIAGNAPLRRAASTGWSAYTNSASYLTCGLFLANSNDTANSEYRCVAVQLDAAGAWPAHTPTGRFTLDTLSDRQAIQWDGATVLLPMREYENVESNKRRLIVDAGHARNLRMPNLEPGQRITLGTDHWRVYPIYRRNASVPNGGSNHSGTNGWALRE